MLCKFLLIYLLLLCPCVCAQDILIIDGLEEIINPHKYMLIYEDKSRVLKLEQILTSSLQQKFEPMPEHIVNFGNS